MNQDFKELLHLFAEHEVEYLIAGGYAVVHHTQPRYTKDLDLWINPSVGNSHRVGRAFMKFGVPLVEVTLEDFASEGLQFTIGVEPSAIDFLTSIPGVDFSAAWENRIVDESFGFPVFYMSKPDLIAAKVTAGRPVDLADVEELQRASKSGKRQ